MRSLQLYQNQLFNGFICRTLYYGISAAESRRSGLAAYKADSSISPVLGLNVAHRIDANWTVFGSTYMKFLSSEVKDSPMTEGKSAAWTVGAGVMYHFD